MFSLWNLISEDKGKTLSLGRTSFWIVFGICIYFWMFLPVSMFPETLFYTLAFLMIYNVSKKSLRILDVVIERWLKHKTRGGWGRFAGDLMEESRRYGGGYRRRRRRSYPSDFDDDYGMYDTMSDAAAPEQDENNPAAKPPTEF